MILELRKCQAGGRAPGHHGKAYIFEGSWGDHCGWTGEWKRHWVKRSGLTEPSRFVGPQLRKVSKFIVPIILFTRLWFHFCLLWGSKARKVGPTDADSGKQWLCKSRLGGEMVRESLQVNLPSAVSFFPSHLEAGIHLTRWIMVFAAENCWVKKRWHFALRNVCCICNTSILRWRGGAPLWWSTLQNIKGQP